MQTYTYLKSVADDYAEKIKSFKIYENPDFDIPVDDVIRILGAAILTAKKIGNDDYESIMALVNLLILNNKKLSGEICRKYFDIVKKCIMHCSVKIFRLSWSDFERDGFMIGLVETKLAQTEFSPSDSSNTTYIYENRGSLVLKDDGMVLSNVNYHDSRKLRLKTELRTSFGLEVKSTNPANASDIKDLMEIYPYISGDFDNMKPSVAPTLKTYTEMERIVVRVKRISGQKIEVETIDPTYVYEDGNVFIDTTIALIPKESMLDSLKEGDYLPVVRNRHPTMTFRIDRNVIAEFVEYYTNEHMDEYVNAIPVSPINGGSRWLSELGISMNVFDKETAEDGLEHEFECAVKQRLPGTLKVHLATMDAKYNCLVKAKFDGCIDESDIESPAIFEANAYARFFDEFFRYVKAYAPEDRQYEKIESIEPPTVRLLAILTNQMALRLNRGDSFARMEQLIVAMLLMRMVEADDEVEFIRCRLDYQKAIILFANGVSPAALPVMQQSLTKYDGELTTEKEIVEIMHDYREYTDGDHDLHSTIGKSDDLDSIASTVKQLVKASNSLIGKIDKSEINRIKKTICSHLDVADQYNDIFSKCTNYGVESDFLEFKASCVLPPDKLRSSSLIKDMEFQKWTILKTVCAFFNSINGGELLIGVADSGFAVGLKDDMELLYREHRIFEPTADRLRTYLKLFIDQSFITSDGRVSGTAITAGRVQLMIEQNQENIEILRVKISPYPWDVVKISAPDKPNGFHDVYIRTSGASTPLNSSGVRETKLRKMRSLDKDHYKTARILQAIDDKLVIEIKNYSGATGLSDRRLEPYKILGNNKGFLAYDLTRHDMRMFKFSRFKDADLKLTSEKWKNQKKHIDRELDIFGMVETDNTPQERVRVKLSDYARSLLFEECSLDSQEENGKIISRNTDYNDSKRYPWQLDVNVNALSGVARFIMGLPGHTKVVSTPRLDEYIDELMKLR
ncbi:MAG: WYL domain-containing protein [Bacteroides sp.]|nr:WYL domain-containing protein [Bacteroides sp.]